METNPQLAIVFIHYGGATSPLPTSRCLTASWFHLLLRPGPCWVLAGCHGNHTQGQGRGEERREGEMLTYAGEGEGKRVMLLPCDWLQASSNPTHPPCVSSSLVQNSWLLLLLLLACSHPLCVSLSHCQWCCAACVDLLPNQRTQGEEKTAAVEAACGHREDTLETGIFSEAVEWLRLSTRTERKEDWRRGCKQWQMGKIPRLY